MLDGHTLLSSQITMKFFDCLLLCFKLQVWRVHFQIKKNIEKIIIEI